MKIKVNQQYLEARQGETILECLSRNGIHVPTLCHMKDFFPSGACRMCVVENEAGGRLIPACSQPLTEGLAIRTHSPRVVETRKTIVELLLSNHPDDCLYCIRNGQCSLQDLALEHHVTERRLSGAKNRFPRDLSSPSISRDPEKCILCGRCVRVCEEVMGVSAIDFTGRGSKTRIGTAMNDGMNTSSCVNCGQCIHVCPTGALSETLELDELESALADPGKMVVVQYAPAVTVSLAQSSGLPEGTDMNGKLNAALRRIGFKYVFDTSFAADLTIMEESAELIKRISEGETLPMITSCCPAWIKYAETFAPDFLDHLSSCKSPQQMMGSVIRNWFGKQAGVAPGDIVSVSVMPCTAKKFEAKRPEMSSSGMADVDIVITTRELIRLLKMRGIRLEELEPEVADSPLAARSSAGKLFGGTGGVMEAALRTAYFRITGEELKAYRINSVRGTESRKEAKVAIGDLEVGIAVVSGLQQAGKLLDEIRNGRSDIHFIEIMACPGGCIAGGGQPFVTSGDAISNRLASLYAIDNQENLKVSHKNPEIRELYEKFLGEPMSGLSHNLLHTHYITRDVIR
ncbi:MAG: NADH-dependent [FeFe] hydrogenase, group A6 [Bacteroidales bacterium]